jgi:hypothetical protein
LDLSIQPKPIRRRKKEVVLIFDVDLFVVLVARVDDGTDYRNNKSKATNGFLDGLHHCQRKTFGIYCAIAILDVD